MKRLIALVLLSVVAVGCSKKVTKVAPDILIPERPIVQEKAPEPEIVPVQNYIPAEAPAGPRELTVYYDFGKYDLKTGDALKLDLTAAMALSEGCRVVINGGCCPIGSEEYNIGLGAARSNTVREYLITRNVPESMIDAWSWGETHLITEDPAYYWQNRRAEVRLQ